MTRFATWRRAAAILALAILVLPGAALAQAKKPPIKIGTFLTASGEGAFLGAPALAALQLAIEKANKRGGVLGRKLELVFYDTGLDVQKAQIAVQRLIDVDKVDVIVGGSTTGAAMAVVPLVQQTGTPFISLANAVALVEPVRQWVFKTSHTDRMACRRIFGDLAKRGLTHVGILASDSGFGRSMRFHCTEIAAGMAIEIVANQSYPAQTKDVTKEVTEVSQAPGIQAIVNIGAGDGPVRVTRARRQLGVNLPLYESHGVATPDYILRSGEAAEGVRLPAPALVVGEHLPPKDPQRRSVLKFIHDFRARWEVDPTVQSGYAYDGIGLALAAIVRANSTDKAKVRDELERTRGYIGITGIVHMSSHDHQGLSDKAFRMVEIRNGTWVVID